MPQIGLKDLHAAVIEEDGSYGTPERLAKAIEAKITPNVSTAVLHADDGVSESNSTISGIDVELTVDSLSTKSYNLIMGKTANADGVVVDKVGDTAPYVALGYRSEKSTGKYVYVWMYKGKFQQAEETYKTKGEEIEYQTPTIKATFVGNEDTEWRAKVDEEDSAVKPEVIANWFKEVYVETPVV